MRRSVREGLVLFAVLLAAAAGCRTSPGASARTDPFPPSEVRAAEAPPVALPERLTVAEAVEEALAQNRTILQARLGVLIGGTQADEAKAALYPALDVRGTYSRRDKAPLAVAPELGTSFSVGPREVFGLNVIASWSIYGFGRHIHAYRAARLQEGRLDADREAAEADIAAAVTAAAFDLLEGIRAIEVARADEEALQRQVHDAQALLDAGRVTKVDVLEAEVEHDASRRAREKLESAVPLLRIALNALLGRATDAPTEIVDEPSAAAPAWDATGVLAEALVARPEMRAASLEVDALERERRAAAARELPELSGTLTYTSTTSPFTTPSDAVILGLSLDIPVFTAGARSARIRRAELDLDQARLRRLDVETLVRSEVAEALRNVDESYRDIEVAARSIAKAEESLRIQREKFTSGRATSREVLDSTALLSRTRFAHLTSLFNYNVALRALHRARGADPRSSPLP